MFLILIRNILCPQQMFPSLRSPRNIMGNNVSATMCPRLPGPLQNPDKNNYAKIFRSQFLLMHILKYNNSFYVLIILLGNNY